MHLFIVVLNPIDAIGTTLATKGFFVIQLHLNGCCNLKFKYLCRIPHIYAPFELVKISKFLQKMNWFLLNSCENPMFQIGPSPNFFTRFVL